MTAWSDRIRRVEPAPGSRRRLAWLALPIVLVVPLMASTALAARSYRNLTIEELLERLERDGVVVFYSSDLVKPWMRVRDEPTASDPRLLLEQVLAPYDLTVSDGPDGALVLIRASPAADPAPGSIVGTILRTADARPVAGLRVSLADTDREATTDSAGRFEFRSVPPGRYVVELDDPALEPTRERVATVSPGSVSTLRIDVLDSTTARLEEIVVHGSQYHLVRKPITLHTSLTTTDLQSSPDIGDDPLRAVARLPGAASSDFSAKTSLRGGEVDETLVRFDDLRLYNPFHLKDFQSLFSAIDPGIVSGIDVYTGGFPAAFGDRMSGVLDVASLPWRESPYGELSVSFFNASALAGGTWDEGAGDWLVSARRGNLDLIVEVVDPSLGQPRYTDLHARLSHRPTDSLALSGNFLLFDDDILLFDSDQEEQAHADYRDEYYWLRVDQLATDRLSGQWLLAHSRLSSERRGQADLPGVSRGMLDDRRSFAIDSLQTDWSWQLRDGVRLDFGGEWRSMSGRYDYRDEAEFDVLVLAPGASLEPARSRELSLRPQGDYYGVHASVQVEPIESLSAVVGLRWERETLSGSDNEPLSPRLSLLYRLGERTRLRASWGRFLQTQTISELQVADGESQFFPPQRADHLLAGVEHLLPDGLELRLEAYRKDYRRPRPRYENLLNTFILLPELKPDRVRIAPDRATARGVELSLGRREPGPLAWWMSYTWSSVEDSEGGVSSPRSWDQTHFLSGGLAWRSDRWELSLAATYHTGWPTTTIELVATEPIPLALAGPRNGTRLGSYLAFDARVARKYRLESAGTVTVFLELTNLLNRSNDCCVEYEIEDEDDELALDVGTLSGLPLVPSLGFVWQF